MAIEDTLATIDLFADLDKSDLARIAKATVVRNFKGGDIIVREGEAGVGLYIISKGSVEVVKSFGSANEHVVGTLKGGEFFGEMALFDSHLRSASVRAITDCECLVLTKWDFNAELTQNSHVAMAMLAVLSRRIRNLLADAVTH